MATNCTTVYTKIDGELAAFYVETLDAELARETVRGSMAVKHKSPVLAIVYTKKPTKKPLKLVN